MKWPIGAVLLVCPIVALEEACGRAGDVAAKTGAAVADGPAMPNAPAAPGDRMEPGGRAGSGGPGEAAADDPTPAPGPAAPGGKREAVGPLEFTLPEGWTRGDGEDGWTVLVPPDVPDPTRARVRVRADRPLQGTRWATQRKLWESDGAAFGMKVELASHSPDGPGRFIWTSGQWRKEELVFSVDLFTSIAEGKVVQVLSMGTWTSPWSFPLQKMLRESTIKGAPPLVRPAVVEAFSCIRVRPVIYGTRVMNQLFNDRLILLAGGVLDTWNCHDAGLDGCADLPKVDPDLRNGWYGRWEAEGKEVRITLDKTTEVLSRDGPNLRSKSDVWKPMPNLNGLRLNGRFGRQSKPGDASQFHQWIEFSEDGRFSMEGVLWSPLLDGETVKVPDRGRGTYEIRNWTLWLKVDTGFTQSQDFSIIDEAIRKPTGVFLRTRLFEREK